MTKGDFTLTPDASVAAAVLQRPGKGQVLVAWDGASGRTLGCLEFDVHVRCIAVSLDGSLVAAGQETGRIVVWSPVTGRTVTTLDNGRNRLNCLSFGRIPSSIMKALKQTLPRQRLLTIIEKKARSRRFVVRKKAPRSGLVMSGEEGEPNPAAKEGDCPGSAMSCASRQDSPEAHNDVPAETPDSIARSHLEEIQCGATNSKHQEASHEAPHAFERSLPSRH